MSARAGEAFGYSPTNFPTGGVFSWSSATPPPGSGGLTPKQAAIAYDPIQEAGVTPPPLAGITTLWVQHSLNELGAKPKLVEDGIVGSATKSMITIFQRENSLAPTGIADEATVAELKKHLVPSSPQVASQSWWRRWFGG